MNSKSTALMHKELQELSFYVPFTYSVLLSRVHPKPLKFKFAHHIF